ncbi:unnamed protein product [Rotaria magnacalcarata]|uniref:Uncharacterized protein n=2 Tax=Rotaria magnacalcarata TaxID=392030 RepID=A0A816QQY4_9BILA|nr:unnamed protein product [Rotaria magnacalcarata]CAF1654923.1 unnamed protein product [Rotaria magnacalcarata]CAF2057259.1 unnamed protein product [Rotaria magnacalcarata]CAF2064073.1 unnamed protein product [Rotaria magnacalcarata]CAF4033606.1 unnamed protein product [Rotaria magnacalcarata]
MLSYGVYAALLFSSLFIIVLGGAIVLLNLPLRKLVTLLQSIFHFTEVRSVSNDYIIIDVCGDEFEISKKLWNRLPLVFALGMCLLVTILVFIEGCIFSTRHVYSTKVCSERVPNCYLFKSQLTSFKPLYEFVCEPNQPVIPSNMSASYAVCYGFVLPDQSSIDILNQLGVCTGILSLVESVYPLAYKFAHKKYGWISLIILFCALVILETTILAMQLNITFMTIILLTLTQVLIITIFILHYRKVHHPDNISRVESYIELNDVN